ncbi:MAG: CpaF family protein [Lachnospiraceae bacterium]|nr:CpaF family protein [Lachnospiraceae bacterium]
MKDLRRKLYKAVVSALPFDEELSDDALYRVIDEKIAACEGPLSLSRKIHLREAVFSAIRELDILSVIMKDTDITEIMVNGPEDIFIEKNGVLSRCPESFTTPEKLDDVIQRIASSVNRRVNEASPMADARLPDGSRVNIILPPVSLDGPALTIRRFPEDPIHMEDLIRLDSISEEAARYLKTLVECGYNIFISGGTGAGKTTFLGALSGFIPGEERIITIEDSAELRLSGVKNLIRLECRPPNLEGDYEITIRDLLKNALRMRPDRIIVGEVRGAETVDLLQALNTGHSGSLSTGHANSAFDMLSRLEMMVLMGMDIPLQAVRQQIASGLDILVHLSRLRDRTRRVMGIYELAGIRQGRIRLHPLFEFREEGEKDGKIIGSLVKSEYTLEKREKLALYGASL